MSGRRCLICHAASRAECAGGMDPRRTFAEPCGPFVTPTLRELWGSAPEARHADEDAIVRIFGMGHNAPRIVGLTDSDDTPPRGVPAYHPTEAQPIRFPAGQE